MISYPNHGGLKSFISVKKGKERKEREKNPNCSDNCMNHLCAVPYGDTRQAIGPLKWLNSSSSVELIYNKLLIYKEIHCMLGLL